ncbi:MAG: molybdenum cofactor guanylyltransferase [Acidobacteriota bacterium]|nr:molybdenum cofactor guanylyltransferase [Acidobacteriota bacterium]
MRDDGPAMNCYLLIGGESRRMGRSKVELFLARTIEVARPVFEEVIAVQRSVGPPASTLGIQTIFEPTHEQRAPVFGVLRALEHAADRAFILAVDYPLMTSDALRLIAAHESDAPLVVPEWDGIPQMLCGVYSTALAPRIAVRIAEGRFDLRGLLDEAAGEIIREDELRASLFGEPLRNVNTPEDLGMRYEA